MAELQSMGAGDGAGAEPVADELVAQDEQTEQAEGGQAQGQPQPVDLSQHPQFREFQRSYDQKFAMMQQQLAAAQAKADEQAMAGMDDFEKVEFQLQKERAEKQEILAQYQAAVAEQYKARGLAAMAQQYNVPIDVLDGRSPEAAEASALRYQLAQLQKQQGDGQAAETAERNRVDVGGGAPNGESARMRLELKRAKENNDTRAYNRVLRDAEARGVAIY